MIPESALSALSVLNVGAGDLHIEFDKSDPADVEKAQGIIEDMLKRGYAILVRLEGGGWRRVEKFDKRRSVYVVSDSSGSKSQKKKATKKELPMKTTRAVGVAPTSGG